MNSVDTLNGRLLRRPIMLIVAAFLILGGIYLFTTPLFEAPDEYAHYEYVRYLAEHHALPPLFVSTSEWEQGQVHQPPLYYALGAVLVGNIDSPGWETAYPRNPYAALGIPDSPGNKNAVLAPAALDTQSKRTAIAVHLLRALSLLCSAVTVWLAHRTAIAIFPAHPSLALGTAAIVAFNPQFLFISASANNDVLVTTLASAVLLLAVRVARTDGRSYHTPLAMGALAGLAALSKISGLASLALVPCGYLLHYLSNRPNAKERLWPELVRPTLMAFVMAALVAGGWFLRNIFFYDDVLGMAQYTRVFAVHSEPLSLLASLRVLYEAIPSYWGVFGWMNVLAPAAYYRVMEALTLLAGLGLVLRLFTGWRRRLTLDPATVRAALVAAAWVAVMLALIIRWTQTITRTQGRLLFPAAGVLALAFALGLTTWLPQRARKPALALSCVLLCVLALAMPWAVITPAYAAPARLSVSEIPAEVPRLDAQFGDHITMLGATVLSEEVLPDGEVWARLYWQTDAPLDESHTVALQLVGADGERLGGVDTLPAMGRYPTTHWAVGEVVVDDCALRVAPNADGPLAPELRVSLYGGSHTEPLPATAEGNALGTSVSVGRVRLAGTQPWEGRTPEHTLDIHFGEQLALRGYDLATDSANGDADILELALYWEGLARPSASYTVFVHLLDDNGAKVAQADAPPLGGQFDTLYWRMGDRVYDPYWIAVPEGAATTGLTLRVGLYDRAGGVRLPVTGSEPAQDYVDIGPFEIAPGGVLLDGTSF